MTTAVRRRRGTTAQHATFTGLEGEISIDTTKDTVVVHDGTTAGGHPLAKENNTALTGNVTVTTNSSSTALTITQDGTGNALEVRDVTGDTTPFVVTSDGNVFIGTPTVTAASAAVLQITSDGTSSPNSNILQARFSDSTSPYILQRKARGTKASPTVVVSGDSLGATLFHGHDGTNFIQAADIQCYVDGTPGTNDMPGRLVFSTTADGASSPTERMRIDSSGNVRIGVTAASGADENMTVNGFAIVGDRTNTNPAVMIGNTGSGSGVIGTFSNHSVEIRANNTERMRITSAGLITANNSTGLGYGTGSGGTVTQATSKSTAVTLNKPSGQITMHNDALAAGASVNFTLTNSTISTDDLVVCVVRTPFAANYSVRAGDIGTGSTLITLTNTSGASASDSVIVTFAVIKGSAS